ncbi:MAG: hypothetical protein JO101_03995, partial [Candidatus Eremiobacteraeota bacterium]|nr:hypothetical protein [Candidatus Eremiobacteraeota bacterium]
MTYRWSWWFPQTPEALWPYVSDTDRLNRDAGLPPVTYRYEPLPGGGSRTIATAAAGPLRVRWIEEPWDWSENEYHRVVRRYLGGPLETFSSEMRLVP